jgi:hypothetical protein
MKRLEIYIAASAGGHSESVVIAAAGVGRASGGLCVHGADSSGEIRDDGKLFQPV